MKQRKKGRAGRRGRGGRGEMDISIKRGKEAVINVTLFLWKLMNPFVRLVIANLNSLYSFKSIFAEYIINP